MPGLSLIALATALLPATPPLSRAAVVAPRARVPLSFVGPEDNAADVHQAAAPAMLYRTTENGLKFKDLVLGEEGDVIAADDMVSIRLTTTLVSTGEIVQKGAFTYIRDASSPDIIDEAMDGMRVGGQRRVLVPPSSKYAALEDETVEMELETIAIKGPGQKVLLRTGQAVGQLSRLAFWYIITTDLLQLAGVLPSGAGGVVAQNVDAANAWAAQGLSQVGLM